MNTKKLFIIFSSYLYLMINIIYFNDNLHCNCETRANPLK